MGYIHSSHCPAKDAKQLLRLLSCQVQIAYPTQSLNRCRGLRCQATLNFMPHLLQVAVESQCFLHELLRTTLCHARIGFQSDCQVDLGSTKNTARTAGTGEHRLQCSWCSSICARELKITQSEQCQCILGLLAQHAVQLILRLTTAAHPMQTLSLHHLRQHQTGVQVYRQLHLRHGLWILSLALLHLSASHMRGSSDSSRLGALHARARLYRCTEAP
mmetsp:Transcript_31943/g.70645  ORF Transcript_31943/g.70645 Transcript_31943/m.70645 type:complete len:217 (+) Transcript_31943:1219-1869(+)